MRLQLAPASLVIAKLTTISLVLLLATSNGIVAQQVNSQNPCNQQSNTNALPVMAQAAALAQQFVCLLRQEYGSGFQPVFYYLSSPRYLECQRELLTKGESLALKVNAQIVLDKWSDEELQQHHQVTLNFIHFTTLAVLRFQEKTNNDTAQLSDIPQIKNLARSEPTLRQLLQINTNNEALPVVIKTRAQLALLHTRLNNVIIAAQNYLASDPLTTKPSYIAPQISIRKDFDTCTLGQGEIIQIKVPLASFLPMRKTPIDFSYILSCKQIQGELKIIEITISDFY
jgi:hypothetical protein